MTKWEERVITRRQSRGKPRCGCVACRTGGRPSRRYVVWIRRTGKVSLVARIAGGRRPRIDVVHVALDAINAHVRPGQWERRVVVIEGCSGPSRCAVTGIACRWESRCRVVRIGRAGPIRLVAAVARCWQRSEVIVRVALGACKCRMRSCQRKYGCMVEGRWAPTARRMADRTIRREPRRNVIRIGGAGEIRLMTGIAGGRRIYIIVVRMTLHARKSCMRSGQWIVGIGRVVKSNCRPVAGVMTGIAGCWKSRCNVVRVRCSGEVSLMAAVAVGRQSRIVIVRMALRARHCGMSSGKRKHGCVIKARWIPRGGRMTKRAIRREP